MLNRSEICRRLALPAAIAAGLLVAALAPAPAAGAGSSATDGRPAEPPPTYRCPLPPQHDPTGAPGARTRFDARELKGLTIAQAEPIAAEHGCTIRVVRRNGRDLAVTEDFSNARINVNIRQGKIKRIRGIY